VRFIRFINFLLVLFTLSLIGVGQAQGDEHTLGLAGVGQAQGDAQPPSLSPTITWSHETLDSIGDVGSYTSLALNSAGQPQISYLDTTTGNLNRAYFTTNPINYPCLLINWECEKYDTFGADGSFTAMDIRSNGNYGILYLDESQGKIYFRGDQGNGQFVGPKEIEDVGDFGRRFNSLQYDRDGIAHALFATGSTSSSFSVRYAKFVNNGGNCGSNAWQCETVIYDSGSGPLFASLDLNYYGSPRMAVGVFNGLYYVSRVGSGGNCTGIYRCDQIEAGLAVAAGDIYQPSCQVICTSPVQIAYYDLSNGRLKIATSVESGGNCGVNDQAGKWQCDILETVGLNAEIRVSMFMHDGQPFIAYTDGDDRANTTLKIAYPSPGGNCGPTQNGAGTWQCETVDSGFRNNNGFPLYHSVGRFPSIGINSDDIIYISHYDSSSDDLLLAAGQLNSPPPPTFNNKIYLPAVFR
jgi:hypothetical protein